MIISIYKKQEYKVIGVNFNFMRDLCIPLPGIFEGKQADVIVTIDNRKIEYHFRVESFAWDNNDFQKSKKKGEIEMTPERIRRLKKTISEYDKNWELVQIFDPGLNSKFIKVLYRKKN
jgi:hypothetical protein